MALLFLAIILGGWACYLLEPVLRFPHLSAYCHMVDSYRTFGLLTWLCLLLLRSLLSRCLLFCTIADSGLFVLVEFPLTLFTDPHVHINAVLYALRTPSEFSSVPILVADELAHSSSCETTILGEYPIPIHSKSETVALQL